ncbi:MAG: response regulator [Nitrosopumilus sp.]|nr:response regulator [Nitrosopumilus sp.]
MAILTAIIVDDEPGIAELFSGLLELQRIKIVGIGQNGLDAIRLVNSTNPDIVFLDINMPKMNGTEALKEIKKNSPTTKIIMMTADEFTDKEQLSQFGADALIFKPFDMPQIIRLCEKIERSENLRFTQIK